MTFLEFAGDEAAFISERNANYERIYCKVKPDLPALLKYPTLADNWTVFAAAFPHQAYQIHQLKTLYDNLNVDLNVFQDMHLRQIYKAGSTREFDDEDLGYHDDFSNGRDALNFVEDDPFEFFRQGGVDFMYRRTFLELFTALIIDGKKTAKGIVWRELGRSILENACDRERANLVASITSTAWIAAVDNGTSTAPTGYVAVWKVRRTIVFREAALQKSLARLRELLDKGKEKKDVIPTTVNPFMSLGDDGSVPIRGDSTRPLEKQPDFDVWGNWEKSVKKPKRSPEASASKPNTDKVSPKSSLGMVSEGDDDFTVVKKDLSEEDTSAKKATAPTAAMSLPDWARTWTPHVPTDDPSKSSK